jgi:hypothetical protein
MLTQRLIQIREVDQLERWFEMLKVIFLQHVTIILTFDLAILNPWLSNMVYIWKKNQLGATKLMIQSDALRSWRQEVLLQLLQPLTFDGLTTFASKWLVYKIIIEYMLALGMRLAWPNQPRLAGSSCIPLKAARQGCATHVWTHLLFFFLLPL